MVTSTAMSCALWPWPARQMVNHSFSWTRLQTSDCQSPCHVYEKSLPSGCLDPPSALEAEHGDHCGSSSQSVSGGVSRDLANRQNDSQNARSRERLPVQICGATWPVTSAVVHCQVETGCKVKMSTPISVYIVAQG